MNSQGAKRRECCKHGSRCYRTNNPVHRLEASHPGDADYTLPVYEEPPTDVPPCRFAEKCIRRNPLHFSQYSHPSVVVQKCTQEKERSDPLDPLRNNKVTLIKNLQPGKEQTIRARVTIKSDKHLYKNGTGIMFTIDLIDASGEIRLSAFGTFVHQFFDLVEINKIYYFINTTVEHSKSGPGVIQVNQFKLTIDRKTQISLDINQIDDLPHLSFNFEALENINSKSKNDVMDIIAICQSYANVEDVILKNKEQGRKREIYVVDQSNKEVMVTIWGKNAEKFDTICTPGCVLAFKRARVLDWMGKSLESSCLSSSTFMVDPMILEAFTLRYWYESKSEN